METLTLGRLNRANPLIASLPAVEALQIRDDAAIGEPQPWLDREYSQLSLGDVDLSYAGRHAPRHPVHSALAALEPGATLHLREVDGRWELFDDRDQRIGRMAQRFSIPPGRRPAEVRLAAVIVRRREDSDAEFQRILRCDHWEVALPEAVFVPD